MGRYAIGQQIISTTRGYPCVPTPRRTATAQPGVLPLSGLAPLVGTPVIGAGVGRIRAGVQTAPLPLARLGTVDLNNNDVQPQGAKAAKLKKAAIEGSKKVLGK